MSEAIDPLAEKRAPISPWAMFTVALLFIVGGQIVFYAVAFSLGADPLPPPAASAAPGASATDAAGATDRP